MRVPDFVVREADCLSKETRLSFRDCLDILMHSYLTDEGRRERIHKSEKREKVGVGA